MQTTITTNNNQDENKRQKDKGTYGTATVASLGELLVGAGGLGLGLDLASLHGRGQETDRDNLTSLQLGDGAGSVSTAGETLGPLAILVANEGLFFE